MQILNLTTDSHTCLPSTVQIQFKLLELIEKNSTVKEEIPSYRPNLAVLILSFSYPSFITIKQHKTLQCKRLFMEHRFLHINCLMPRNSESKIIF